MSKKLIAPCLAVAVFATLAMASIASASPVLTHPTGTVQVPGVGITATNVGETLMTDTNTNVINRCPTSNLSWEMTKNTGTSIEGNVTAASFTGTGSEGTCTGTFFGSPKVTTAVVNGLPWCVRATSAMAPDEAQMRGGKCSEPAREIRFAIDLGSITCLYARSASEPSKATITTDNAEGQDAVIHLDHQLFKPVSVPFPCPEETLLDMSFTLSSGGTPAFFS